LFKKLLFIFISVGRLYNVPASGTAHALLSYGQIHNLSVSGRLPWGKKVGQAPRTVQINSAQQG
jgi:hypothetical protein